MDQAIGVRRTLEQHGKLGFALGQSVLAFALISNVHNRADDAGRLPGRIQVQGGCGLQPAYALAVRHPVGYEVVGLMAATDGNQRATNGPFVFADDPSQKGACRPLPLVGSKAVQLSGTGGAMQGVTARFPVPDAHLRGIQCQSQAFLAISQGAIPVFQLAGTVHRHYQSAPVLVQDRFGMQ